MDVNVTKITSLSDARKAIETTVDKEFTSTATLNQIYTWMHSPIRTQLFVIKLEDIPTFVSVHLVRHSHIQHFVTSKRVDRGGDGKETRWTPVDHLMYCNAESLITLAHKRICYKASSETRETVLQIRDKISRIDPELAEHMVPLCVYRGGICSEPKPCGHFKVRRYNIKQIYKEMIG